MNITNLLKKAVCGMLVAGAITLVGTSSASADHCTTPTCYYKTVIV